MMVFTPAMFTPIQSIGGKHYTIWVKEALQYDVFIVWWSIRMVHAKESVSGYAVYIHNECMTKLFAIELPNGS